MWNHPTYQQTEKGARMLWHYSQWFDMKQRCTSDRSRGLRPTYRDCTMSTDWLSYDVFMDWAEEQIGFGSRDSEQRVFQLDKDLISDSKLYAPATCVFIPKEINSFLANTKGDKTNCTSEYVGVTSLPSGKYRACIHLTGKGNIHLGCFTSPQDAHLVYKQKRSEIAKQYAQKWDGKIDPRAVQALNAMM